MQIQMRHYITLRVSEESVCHICVIWCLATTNQLFIIDAVTRDDSNVINTLYDTLLWLYFCLKKYSALKQWLKLEDFMLSNSSLSIQPIDFLLETLPRYHVINLNKHSQLCILLLKNTAPFQSSAQPTVPQRSCYDRC